MKHIVTRFKTFRLGVYETIAFLTGFVLMSYELVAARLLAPSIGTSMYVWTSVIGTMIAALALGYAAGGWVADKRTAKQDVAWLLLASCMAVVGTLVFYQETLAIIADLTRDQRVQGVLAALLLFMPASFLLGMISPYLVRLRTKSVETTGRSVAGLSALNSIGGISGTFATGFGFFTWFGSRETLVLVIALLLICSWMILPRLRMAQRLAITIGLVVVVVLQFASPVQAGSIKIDTPSAHYEVIETLYGGQPVRVLMTGPFGYQSGVFADGDRELAFAYTIRMAELVEAAPQKDRILVLGGGALTLPDYLARAYPESQVDVVEIDPKLVDIAKDHFNYSSPENIQVFAEDARAYVNRTNEKYDIIIGDVYSDSFIPFSLTTREYTARLKQILKPDGAVITNVIGSTNAKCVDLLAGVYDSHAAVFARRLVVPVHRFDLEGGRQNVLTAYSNGSLDWARGILYAQEPDLPKGPVFTDNFAPVEPMTRRCNTTAL